MSDTTRAVADRYRALMLEQSAAFRLHMACEMFDAARQLMIAGIKTEDPDISDGELRVRIFKRTYGREFTTEEQARIVARLRREAGAVD
jgi:hypothetical protein